MKRAIIVHCWGGNPEYAWYPDTKKQLEKLGYVVSVPAMPNTDEPQLTEWLPYLTSIIGVPDEELVLIGHSLGNVTIMRYLESLSADQTVSRVIMVAAFTDQLGFKELENFFETRLNFEAIQPKAKGGFVVIQSDNDPYVSAQYDERLKEDLAAKLIIKHNAGHFSGEVDKEETCLSLPDVVENI